jgi:hypothetical protein
MKKGTLKVPIWTLVEMRSGIRDRPGVLPSGPHNRRPKSQRKRLSSRTPHWSASVPLELARKGEKLRPRSDEERPYNSRRESQRRCKRAACAPVGRARGAARRLMFGAWHLETRRFRAVSVESRLELRRSLERSACETHRVALGPKKSTNTPSETVHWAATQVNIKLNISTCIKKQKPHPG